MKLCRLSLLLTCLVATAAIAEPAVWAPHELIVDLHELPRQYSCDELWYKFRGVLLAVGARQDMEILPYRCEANSPHVQLKFYTPRLLQGASSKWSELSAVTRTVQIAPGSPDKLNSGDCELVRQINASLLKYLDDRVISYRLPCKAPGKAGQPAYSLTIDALLPVPAAMASK